LFFSQFYSTNRAASLRLPRSQAIAQLEALFKITAIEHHLLIAMLDRLDEFPPQLFQDATRRNRGGVNPSIALLLCDIHSGSD
jgi:hypothetical protein